MTSKPSTPRVQRSRERMRTLGCRRVEFTLDSEYILKIRQLAYQLHIPLWQALEEAIDLLEHKAGEASLD